MSDSIFEMPNSRSRAAFSASRVAVCDFPVTHAADSQVPAPAAFLALESMFGGHSFQPGGKRRERARFEIAQAHPNRARMLEVGERADSRRGELERLGLRRELSQPDS